MVKETMHCDECGEQKKDANHWFVAGASPLGVTFNTFANAQGDAELLRVLFLYCGQRCVDKAFQRWKDTGHLERQNGEVVADQPELVSAG